MKTVNSAAIGLLAVFAATPVFAQNAQEFTGAICEIDTSVLNMPAPVYQTPDGTRSVFTFDSDKLCTGVASLRNIKLVCTSPLPNWNRPDMQARNFSCTINPDQCGLSPLPGDVANRPYVTTTDSVLKVASGIATLTCMYKPAP